MNTKKQTAAVLTVILIPDKKLGGFTATFKELPECIAEGADLPSAIANLSTSLEVGIRNGILLKDIESLYQDVAMFYIPRSIQAFVKRIFSWAKRVTCRHSWWVRYEPEPEMMPGCSGMVIHPVCEGECSKCKKKIKVTVI